MVNEWKCTGQCRCPYPSINLQQAVYSGLGLVDLEPIQIQRITVDGTPNHHRTPDTHIHILGQFIVTNPLTGIFLGCGRNPEETQRNTGRTCNPQYRQLPKLRIEPETLKLSGCNVTQHTTSIKYTRVGVFLLFFFFNIIIVYFGHCCIVYS